VHACAYVHAASGIIEQQDRRLGGHALTQHYLLQVAAAEGRAGFRP
jgi:hypothetical protein